jgi:hypothetical protein
MAPFLLNHMNAFKYLPPDRTDILVNQCIRFTQPKYLNDPFEFLPFISRVMDEDDAHNLYSQLIEPVLNEHGDRKLTIEDIPIEFRSQIPDDIVNQITNLTINEALAGMPAIHPKNLIPNIFSSHNPTGYSSAIRDKWQDMFGVLSLASIHDNITMWSHYSLNHSGFVIEFDLANTFFDRRQKETDLIRCVRKVKYESNRPNIKLYDSTLSERELLNFLVESILLTKSTHWTYEEELRMISYLKETDHVLELGNQTIHLNRFEPSAIRTVYFGVNINSDTRDKIIATLKEQRYQHVKLFQGALNPSLYKIDFFVWNTQ